MDSDKKELNPSSLLDLKAELLKKQEELKKDKGKTTHKRSERAKIFRKTSVWNKKNVGVLERAQRDLEVKQEEDDVLGRSRKQLEAKTRLYEAMTCVNQPEDIPTEDGSRRFLVDFEQKAVQSLSDVRRQVRKNAEIPDTKDPLSDCKSSQVGTSNLAILPDGEDWVEYVDQFGRTRCCLKKDLPPEVAKKSESPQNTGGVATISQPQKDLMSADMQRELVRQKWEEHERLTATDPDDPIHYANVQYDEIRTHGTGFYQFAKGEEEREKQLQALRELREQTKDTRAQREKLQHKKKSLMRERLLKVKRRKLLREGKNPDEIMEALSSSNDEDDGLIGPSIKQTALHQPKEPELLARDEQLRKDAPTREWDVGKEEEKWFSESRWLEDRRDERVSDFAPPQLYYDSTPGHVSKKVGTTATRNIKRVRNQREAGDYGRGCTDNSKETLVISRNEESIVRQPLMEERQARLLGTEGNKGKRYRANQGSRNPMADLKETLLEGNQSTEDHDGTIDIERELVRKNVKDPMAALEQRLLDRNSKTMDSQEKVGVTKADSALIGQGLREIRSEFDTDNSERGIVGKQEVSYPSSREGHLLARGRGESQSALDLGTIPLPTSADHPSSGSFIAGSTTWQRVTDSSTLAATNTYNNQYYGHYGAGTNPEYAGWNQFTADNYPSSSNVYAAATVSVPHSQLNISSACIQRNNPNAVVTSDTNPCINSTAQEVNPAVTASESVPVSTTETSTIEPKAPQPAHFASGPTKSDPKRQPVRYERVNLYNIPDELPAPIASNNLPEYPSMQEPYGSRTNSSKAPFGEEKQIKDWQRQFQSVSRSNSGIQRVKPANIPFVSPYVQSKSDKTERKEEITFDPSKPPPGGEKCKQISTK